MDEQKNLFTALFLMIGLFLMFQVYQLISSPANNQVKSEEVATNEQSESDKVDNRSENPTPTVSDSRLPSLDLLENRDELGDDQPTSSLVRGEKRSILIETDLAVVTLNTEGGVISSYKLKNYNEIDGGMVDLIYHQSADSKVKIIPSPSVKFESSSFSDKLNHLNFEVVTDRQTGEQRDLLMRVVDQQSGIKVEKLYTFYNDKYHFDLELRVISNQKWGKFDYSLLWFGLGDEQSSLQAIYSYQGPIVYNNNIKAADSPDEDQPTYNYEGDIKWGALVNRYYANFITDLGDNIDSKIATHYEGDDLYSVERKGLETGQGYSFRIFLGPKVHKVLKEYDPTVMLLINYGWFDFIARPIYWLLNWFNNIFDNWGWSIIALTVLTKILFFPLTQKSFRSMKALQKLQPHLKRIQTMYKGDKERLNEALMGLYKEHKVNPLSGCMPMLLQIPIFFALYKVLLESIELKGAPWILWIVDLSQKDPYYITPLLMGASMFVQQLLTPSTGDPTQRKIMMILPVVFTFLFLSFPSGLVIYWLVNNLITIAQQGIINREATNELAKET
ncbi:MAG: membrane protein insertase YidC [Nitrospinota bacterium]